MQLCPPAASRACAYSRSPGVRMHARPAACRDALCGLCARASCPSTWPDCCDGDAAEPRLVKPGRWPAGRPPPLHRCSRRGAALERHRLSKRLRDSPVCPRPHRQPSGAVQACGGGARPGACAGCGLDRAWGCACRVEVQCHATHLGGRYSHYYPLRRVAAARWPIKGWRGYRWGSGCRADTDPAQLPPPAGRGGRCSGGPSTQEGGPRERGGADARRSDPRPV